MSALGQKRTHAVQQRMSALPPKADIGQRPLRQFWRCKFGSLDAAADRPKEAIRLSRKDWLLRADRAVLCPVPGADCASGSCLAGLFAAVGLRWWRRWSPHH